MGNSNLCKSMECPQRALAVKQWSVCGQIGGRSDVFMVGPLSMFVGRGDMITEKPTVKY